MAAPEKAPEPIIRQQFGKYALLARIASGGMGEVLLARLSAQAGFEKLVVIKRILPHLTDKPDFVGMFLHEARIAARLTHPNICQVYELGQIQKQYYMAMEYLEGVPFVEVLLARNRAPQLADPRLTCALIAQACEGLHYAHALREPDGSLTRVVHRDVNPKNIFVTSAGSAKILDFGIVKARGGIDLTRSGSVKGTYAYMSPEQIRGEKLDRRSDIFSLGVVTFEAITGTRLFKRPSDLRTFKAITEEPIPRASDVVPGIPQELDDAIATALARDREERYQTAREYALALEKGLLAYGAPFSSIAIASEVEQAFGVELERQRQLVMTAHREGEDEEFDVPTTLFNEDEDSGPRHNQSVEPGIDIVSGETGVNEIPGPEPEFPAEKTEITPIPQMMMGQQSTPSDPHHMAPIGDTPEGFYDTPPPEESGAPSLPHTMAGPVPTADDSGRGRNRFGTPPVTMDGTSSADDVLSVGDTSALNADMDLRPRRRWIGILLGFLVAVLGVAVGVLIMNPNGIRDRLLGTGDTATASAAGGSDDESEANLVADPGSADSGAEGSSDGDDTANSAAVDDDADQAGKDAEDEAAKKAAEEEKARLAEEQAKAAELEQQRLAEDKNKQEDAAAKLAAEQQAKNKAANDAAAKNRARNRAAAAAAKNRAAAAAAKKRAAQRRRAAAAARKRKQHDKPAPKGFGFLTVNSNPYSTVYVDGRKKGVTPMVKLKLRAGRHKVKLISSKNKKKKFYTVTIAPGKTARRLHKW